MSKPAIKKDIPFTITQKALEEIVFIIKNKNIPPDYGLRIGIKGGSGCGGVNYLLGFDTVKESDDIYILEGVKIYMEKKHAMFLAGKEIDFEDGAKERGFIFK
ncbi:MAG: iron-sulfur cluster assembly accessory protein [Cytophagaceae bacterium]|nr:iron-sulfur cluster assembly accessory protein [Cytophagaceae bacterium]